MGYISVLFTYLLTYLLTYISNTESERDQHDRDKNIEN